MSAEPLDYRSAGVDIDEADRALDRIRPLVASTRRPEVLSDVGSFGGLFRLNTAGFRCPVLVASTDGVGTKLRVARDAGRHEVPGYDLVSHCINDILVQGAEPLFFLDYLAMGRLDAVVAEGVIRGIASRLPGVRRRAPRRGNRGDARVLRRTATTTSREPSSGRSKRNSSSTAVRWSPAMC